METVEYASLHPSSYPFATEEENEGSLSPIADRIYDPGDVLNDLRKRRDSRIDLLVTDPLDAKLSWVPSSEGQKAHFSLAPEDVAHSELQDYLQQHGPLEFEWGSTAHRSLCSLMETTPERYKKMDAPEQRFLYEVRDWFSHPRESNKGFIVRTEGSDVDRNVMGFVSGNFSTLDEHAIVLGIMEQLDEAGSYINGVNVLDNRYRQTTSYRIVFGDPIVDRDLYDPSSDLFCMLDVRYSPIGLASFRATLGLWRLICRNGMIRKDLSFLSATWSQHHKESGDSGDSRLFSRTADLVQNVDQFAPAMASAVERLPKLALGEEPREMLAALNAMNLLPKRHHDLAMSRLELFADEPVTTEWDFLNLLTRSAHNLRSIGERQTGEHRAMQMAMQPEAFTGIVQAGFDRTRSKNDLAELRRSSYMDN